MDEATTAPTSPLDPHALIHEPTPGKAPQHLVEILAQVIPIASLTFGPPGSDEYRNAAMTQAQGYADRIWMEAWHAGAVWATATRPVRLEMSAAALDPKFLEEMVERTRQAQEKKAAAG